MFDDELSLGIDRVGLNSLVQVKDDETGTQRFFILTDRTGLTDITTIGDFLLTNQYYEIGQSYNHNFNTNTNSMHIDI